MRNSRFTEEQIVGILQEHAAGAKTGELVRRHGISRETFYKWRRKYGGLKVDEAKRLRGPRALDAAVCPAPRRCGPAGAARDVGDAQAAVGLPALALAADARGVAG